MATGTVEPKTSLDSKQRTWLKEMGAALGVGLQGAPPQSKAAAAPGTPEERTQDVAKRQSAAVDTALKEWDAVVRESGGANRGTRVDEYARNAGFDPKTDWDKNKEGVQGIEWCGAFAGYALTQSGFKDAPSMASYQKARDYFVYRSYTGSVPNEKLDQVRADQEASGSSRKYFLLEGSDSNMAKLAKQPGKYGKDKYAHYDADKNTFDYQNLPIQPGDVALFNHGHVGLVKSYDPKTGILETVEGNAGGELASGKKVGSDAVVKNKYDLSTEKDRKKFDGFGRPSAGDFKDAAPTTGGPSGGGPSSSKPAEPSAKPAANKRTVPGGGGYVYEQHSDGKIFIVESPKYGKTRIEVKDRKGYDAILKEIGPFPTSPGAPGQAPTPGTGKSPASSLLDDLFEAVQDAPSRIGEAIKDVAGGIGDGLGRIADALGGQQQSAAPTAGAPPTTAPGTAAPATPAEPDSYRSQTDNPELAGGTCNVTTLAMQLLSLANGDETKLREEAVQLLKDKGVTAKTSTQLEELLRQLTIKVAGAKQIKLGKSDTLHNAWEVAWVLDKVSELFSGYVSKTETIYPGTNQKGFETNIVPAVDKGAAVMLSNHLTSSGHIVKLNSVRADGVVIDDPNGCVVEKQSAYLRNGAAVNAAVAKRIQDNAKILDERLKLNPSLRKELTELAAAGTGKIPANAGKLNFYTWAEVGTYQIGKWANITYKK